MAQVSQKLANDLQYIQNLSLLMDLRIGAATICEFVSGCCAGASEFLLSVDPGENAPTFAQEPQNQPAEPVAELACAA
jgi:hypothetical protein